MKQSRLRRWQKISVTLTWLKLILGLGIGIGGLAAFFQQPTAEAQTPEPFPGRLIVKGVLPTISADYHLIGLGGNRFLAWVPTTGRSRIWQYDPVAGAVIDPFLGSPVAEGMLGSPGQSVIYLGGTDFLAWEPTTGLYQVRHYDPRADSLSAQAVVSGVWASLQGDFELISLDSEKFLRWEPNSGRYQIWHYKPDETEQAGVFPGELIAEGTWTTIRADHRLVYLGSHRLLDWIPATGSYRIWRYNPTVTDQTSSLSEHPVAEGILDAFTPDQKLVNLGNNRILAWEPTSGQYRVWEYPLTAIGAFSLEDIATLLGPQEVTGITIITHGYQLTDDGGDSLMSLAEAIQTQAGGWLLDYDITDDRENGFFDSCTNDCSSPMVAGAGELVLLFDWAPESNRDSDGWGEAAGDALFNILVGLELIDPTATNIPLHFIAHSFGTAVTSETIERLASFGVTVDQVTYLDPHDFDQGNIPVDGAQRLFDLGQPEGYGAAVWNNVTFADVYYQTQISLFADPEGRPIPGAYNKLLNDLIEANPLVLGPHSYVWKCFYRGTVIGANPSGCDPPQQTVDYNQTGYAFGRIKDSASRPDPNFYSPEHDHFHSESKIVNTTSGEPNQSGLDELDLTEDDIINGRWPAEWDSLTIINGDSSHYYDGSILNPDFLPGQCSNDDICMQPGWSHHAGGGLGYFEQVDSNVYLELDYNNAERVHNWLYVSNRANYLKFDLWRVDGPVTTIDRFEVQLGPQIIASYDLKADDALTDQDFVTRQVAVPTTLHNKAMPLTFKIVRNSSSIRAKVRIDNVAFLTNLKTSYSVYLPLITK